MEKVNTALMRWINPCQRYLVSEDKVVIETDPFTDFWSATNEGYKLSNAPLFVLPLVNDFTFTVCVDYHFHKCFDQAGVMIFIDKNTWIKSCVEYTDETTSAICSTVTTKGFSDFSAYNIGSDVSKMYFRISHHHEDFLIENSFDGNHYKQIRLFHLSDKGKKLDVGVFAASPQDTSFNATFSNMYISPCVWRSEKGVQL